MNTFWTVTYFGALAGLGYVLVGYWVTLMIASAFVRRKTHPPVEPTVSLIIPAHNEAKDIRVKLENTLSLDYPAGKLEILVVSDGSIDGTVEIAREFEPSGVKVLAFRQRRGKTAAINDAAATASGEVICLCDANVMFKPDALKTLVARLGNPRIGAVTGDVRIASHESNFGHGESSYYCLERCLQLAESHVGSLMGVDGGMYVLRKELFEATPEDTILDDFVISMRVIRRGYRVVYEPDAVAHENGTPAAKQEWRRRVRVSAGSVQSLKRREWPPITRPVELWQYVSHKALRWMSPLLLLTLLVSNVLVVRAGWFYQVTLAGQVAMYAAAALAGKSIRFRRTRCGGIAFYFVMSSIAMAVGLFRGLLDRQPVTWAKADRTRTAERLPAPLTLDSPESRASAHRPDDELCEIDMAAKPHQETDS